MGVPGFMGQLSHPGRRSSAKPDSPPNDGPLPQENSSSVRCWSTSDVPDASRLDYYASALSEAIIPLGLENAEGPGFDAEVRFAQIEAIGVCRVTASAHGTYRGASELARTREHRFHLMMALNCSWTADHRGPLRLLPGDILVHDSLYPLRLDIREKSDGINLAVTENWLRQWLPSPGVLVGRRIAGQSTWGSALSSFLAEMTPELINAPPVPLSVLSDQVGSLLALTASDMRVVPAPNVTLAQRSLYESILDCIAQRCTEPQVTATEMAACLDISVRTLHRTLAAAGATFGALLIAARVRVAERMLASPLFNRVTTAEIGRRAGFISASHFTRVIRNRTGRTPLQLRREEG